MAKKKYEQQLLEKESFKLSWNASLTTSTRFVVFLQPIFIGLVSNYISE
ncbi:hypothetical protein [Methanobrevibacter sp.]